MHHPSKLALAILAMSLPLAAAVSAQTASGTPPAVRYGFAVDWSRDRVSSKSIPDSRGSIAANTYVGHVKVTNRSGVPLENLEVRIQVHYKVANGKGGMDEHKDSVKTIPSIKSNEAVTVDSDPILLKATELKGGYYYTDGSSARQSDSIRGAIITLHHAGKQVFEYVSSPALKSLAGKATTSTSASATPPKK